MLLAYGPEPPSDVCIPAADAQPSAISESPDDPALALYKSGYSAVLAKKWDESRKAFQQLLKRYPKTKYADAASYWLAYAYARQEPQKGAEYYRQFLKAFPDSPYFPDAVADLERLGYAGNDLPPAAPLPPKAYDEAAAQYDQQEKLKREQERMQRQLDRMAREAEKMEQQRIELLRSEDEESLQPSARSERRKDPEFEIQVAAIQALSRKSEDPQAFETLKGIALDTAADWGLRAAAVQGLRRFKDRDLTSLFQSLVSDRRTEFRRQVILSMASSESKNDATTQSMLVKFVEDAGEQRDIRMASLVALSDMKYPGLATVLEKIIMGDPDLRVRQEALMIAGRWAHADQPQMIRLLTSVAVNTTEHDDIRETALFALAQIADQKAFEVLKNIASADPSRRVRLTAVHALGKRRFESRGDAEALLKHIATRTSEDRETRLAALYALTDGRGDAPVDLLKDLALNEKDEEVRVAAVHLLASSVNDKGKAFTTLSEIYRGASPQSRSIKESALYGIANIGSPEAVSLLKRVAQNDPDQEIRRQAVYFLGSIGGEEAKAALMEILRKK